jgi:hypothetical protein
MSERLRDKDRRVLDATNDTDWRSTRDLQAATGLDYWSTLRTCRRLARSGQLKGRKLAQRLDWPRVGIRWGKGAKRRVAWWAWRQPNEDERRARRLQRAREALVSQGIRPQDLL